MIREMTEDDISKLVAMGGMMHAESYFKDSEYSASKCKRLGRRIIDNDHLIGLVSEVDGEINGFFLGCIQEHYFSESLMSADLLLYVLPSYRNGLAGARLIKSYIDKAKKLGVKSQDIQLGQTADIETEAVDKLYKKLGFIPCGTIYKMRG